MAKKKTQKSRRYSVPQGNRVRRTSVPTFALSNLERILLTLYSAVPVSVRADLGQRLFYAWTHPATQEQGKASDAWWKAASVRFRCGTLDLSALDDLQAGIDAGGAR
jgi:hypothetical protein